MAIHYTFSTVNWQWNETIHNTWIKIIHTKIFVHYSFKFKLTKQHNKLEVCWDNKIIKCMMGWMMDGQSHIYKQVQMGSCKCAIFTNNWLKVCKYVGNIYFLLLFQCNGVWHSTQGKQFSPSRVIFYRQM